MYVTRQKGKRMINGIDFDVPGVDLGAVHNAGKIPFNKLATKEDIQKAVSDFVTKAEFNTALKDINMTKAEMLDILRGGELS